MTTTTDFVPAELDATRWEALEPLYRALLDREINTPSDLERLILDRSELDSAASEAHVVLYVTMTRHTDNEGHKTAYLTYVENVQPHLKKVSFELDKRIVSSPHRDALDADRYGVLLRDLQADVDIYRDENVPLETEDTKLGQQYAELCGAMTVQFQDEERTLPQMSRFIEETDRTVREEAWRGVSERRFQDHERLHEIFEEMIRIRHQIALNAGFDNYRDYMFKVKHRFDYSPADCEAFHQAAEEVCVPLNRALNEERRETLGLETLRPWDLAVDVKGREPLRPFDDADGLIGGTSRLFHDMSGELGTMFDSLREGDCLDLESRKGKAPGGYQQFFDRSRRPFIFMNASGMQGDLGTMIHEAGHAFHSLYAREEPLLHYRHAPLEFCEVASMSMELLAHPYYGVFYDDVEADRARREHLEDLVRILPWIATIDAFQHWIYTNPEHSRAERTEYWVSLVARFGAGADWTGLEQYREVSWQRQLHLYEVPFYYIEYGIAQLGAMDLWLQSLEHGEDHALDNYRQAMTLGGSRPLPELFGAADLKFDFGPATVKRLMDAVQGKLEALPA